MLHWGVQSENRKKNTSAQKHIYHKHMTCNRGNISSSGKQPSGPAPFITAPVADLLTLVAVQSVTEAVEWGRGVMSVVSGMGARESTLHRSLRVVIQTALAKAPVRGARKDKMAMEGWAGRYPGWAFFCHRIIT